MRQAVPVADTDKATILQSLHTGLIFVAAHSSEEEIKTSVESYYRQEDTLTIPGAVSGVLCCSFAPPWLHVECRATTHPIPPLPKCVSPACRVLIARTSCTTNTPTYRQPSCTPPPTGPACGALALCWA
jgi:hypothetical protein